MYLMPFSFFFVSHNFAAICLSSLSARFPVPRYIVCDQHKSEARFLMAKLNPSTTHNTNLDAGGGGGTQVYTDDVSLRVFMEHLMRLSTCQ